MKRLLGILLILCLFGSVACGDTPATDKPDLDSFLADYRGTAVEGVSNAEKYSLSDAVSEETLIYGLDLSVRTGSLVTLGDNAIKHDGLIGIPFSMSERLDHVGVYVEGIGYYFYNISKDTGTTHGIYFTGLPLGNYSVCPFWVTEEGIYRNDASCMVFNRDGMLYGAGEVLTDCNVYEGKFAIDGDSYVSAVVPAMMCNEDELFSEGDLLCSIKGDGMGVIFGLKGDLTVSGGSKLHYYYVKLHAGTVSLIEVNGAASTTLKEGAYTSENPYVDLKVNVVGNTVTCYTDDTIVLYHTLSQTPVGIAGVRAERIYSSFKGFTVPETSLETYKTYAISELDQLESSKLYDATVTAVNGLAITSREVNFFEEAEIRELYESAVAAIEASQSVDEAKSAYETKSDELNALILTGYRDDAYQNIYDMAGIVYSTIDYDELVTNYLESSSLDYVNIDGMKMVIDIYKRLDEVTYDHRWWIPEPYRTATLLEACESAMAGAETKVAVDELYAVYYYDVLRSVMQKAYEIRYAISKTTDATYDSSDTVKWNLMWNYYGDGGVSGYTFVYEGPIESFVGTTYNNNFRLCPMFYKPGEMYYTVESIVGPYNWGMDILLRGSLS